MRVTFDNPNGVGAPVGNYSHVARVEAGDADFLFISGQVAIDPEGNLVGEGDMARQCEQTLENLRLILEAHGASFADVVSSTPTQPTSRRSACCGRFALATSPRILRPARPWK